jgi:peptidoglycan/xylan/chitin deacetylase (PgdA/CDA1 family)
VSLPRGRPARRRRLVRAAFVSLLARPLPRTALARCLRPLEARRDEAGVLSFPFVRRRRARRLQILVYHRVNDERDAYWPATPVRDFRAHMEHLASHCAVLPLDAAVTLLAAGELPDNAVCVTFDDGYRDTYLHAWPILARLSLPATVFLATSPLDTGQRLWHDALFSAFRQTEARALDGFGRPAMHLPLRTLDERLAAQERVRAFLWSVGFDERRAWLERLRQALGVDGAAPGARTMLSWDEVRRMQDTGIACGAHTVTHPVLAHMPPDRAAAEIAGSKRALERALGARVQAFAYPGGKPGDFSVETVRLVREAGFSCAVTTLFGSNPPGQDRYSLRRVALADLDASTFALRLDYYRFSA